jgi:hypothetical protein
MLSVRTEAPDDEVWRRPAEIMLWKMDRREDATKKIVIFAAAQAFGVSRLRADERCRRLHNDPALKSDGRIAFGIFKRAVAFGAAISLIAETE